MNLKGQSSIETALLIAAAVSALVAMNTYIRRGYQGYLYANASSHGQQFDPRQPHEQHDELVNFTQTQDIEIISGDAAVNLFKEGSFSGGLFGDGAAPGGALPGRALGTKAKVTATWNVQRDVKFKAQ